MVVNTGTTVRGTDEGDFGPPSYMKGNETR